MILDLFQELQISRRWSVRWKALARALRRRSAREHETLRQLIAALDHEFISDEVREIIKEANETRP